jgi:hypothetical protein
MATLTKEQEQSVKRKWIQDDQGMTYLQFRLTVIEGFDDCVMVAWCGMWLGIEPDGYTHS